jgi:rhomboid family GlyGly-CTERM serine protease
MFIPSAFKHGQWWRLFTHPFVHVNLYHLFLDAGAFLLLYKELYDRNPLRKIIYLFTCGTCSLVVALIIFPLVYIQGLCGLSGIAHGFMALTGLEMMLNRKDFGAGSLVFLLVVSKSIYELLTGNVLFSFMHMGLCGFPIASCHAGGVLGGILTFLVGEWIK